MISLQARKCVLGFVSLIINDLTSGKHKRCRFRVFRLRRGKVGERLQNGFRRMTRRPSRLRKLWHIVVGVGLLWSGTWLSVVLFIEQSIEQNTEQTHAPQELAHVAQGLREATPGALVVHMAEHMHMCHVVEHLAQVRLHQQRVRPTQKAPSRGQASHPLSNASIATCLGDQRLRGSSNAWTRRLDRWRRHARRCAGRTRACGRPVECRTGAEAHA